jgi:DNA polymerase
MELGLGFGGGCGAFITFAKVYNMSISEFAHQTEKAANSTLWAETLRKYDWAVKNKFDYDLPKFEWAACEYTKTVWRASHPNTVQFWRDCEEAFKNAVSVPNCWFDAGPKVRIIRRGQWLYAKLPSGRALVYLQPKVIDGECSFMGMNQYSRKWERIKTYSGKLAENFTQALARDVLFSTLPAAEAKGYAVVMRVHDELVAEVPDTDKHSHEELSAIMSTPPAWAPDIPLAAAGFSAYRYKKED